MVAHHCLAIDPTSTANPAARPDAGSGLDVGGCTDEGILFRPRARPDQATAVGVSVVSSGLAGIIFNGLDASHSIPFRRSLCAQKN
jgi:hypothetical protein